MMTDLWMTALKSKYGISITTDNRMLVRQHLYKARLEINDPALDAIAMVLPEQADEIWLVHKDADSLGANHQGHLKPI